LGEKHPENYSVSAASFLDAAPLPFCSVIAMQLGFDRAIKQLDHPTQTTKLAD